MNEAYQALVATKALLASQGIGVATWHNLVAAYGSSVEAYKFLSKERTLASLSSAKRALDNTYKAGIKVLALQSALYPKLLSVIKDAPPLIYIKGNEKLLSNPCSLAVVGAREASLHGRQLAYGIAKDLSDQDALIVSGFAKGIDIAAHKGAVAQGSIAVFAGGCDYIYPEDHSNFVSNFLETGLIVSEHPLGYRPVASAFARRNRLISGLAKGVLVVEAAFKSGSLLTAEYAAQQGREVFAVPGSPMDPRCRGSNRLLRDGAHFVESAADILDVITEAPKLKQQPLNFESKVQKTLPETSALETRILTTLSATPLPLDSLAEALEVSMAQLLVSLSHLEITEKVVRYPGNQFALRL